MAAYVPVVTSITTPNNFVGGTTAVASEVNANFTEHKDGINDLVAEFTLLANFLASTTTNEGASAIGVEDYGGGTYVTGTVQDTFEAVNDKLDALDVDIAAFSGAGGAALIGGAVPGVSGTDVDAMITDLKAQIDALSSGANDALLVDTAYYVDVYSGNDSNVGTLAQPFKTVAKAVSLIPRTLLADFDIRIRLGGGSGSYTFTESITVSDKTGFGNINFRFQDGGTGYVMQWGHSTGPCLTVENVYGVRVNIYGYMEGIYRVPVLSASDALEGLIVYRDCEGGGIDICNIIPTTYAISGGLVVADNARKVRLNDYDLGGMTASNAVILSTNNSYVSAGDCASETASHATYGLQATKFGKIYKESGATQPTGGTANENTATGGDIQ